MLDRQTEQLGIVAGEDIAEVAGRDHKLDLIADVDHLVGEQLGVSGEVVDDLRHQTAHVDGVGGGSTTCELPARRSARRGRRRCA